MECRDRYFMLRLFPVIPILTWWQLRNAVRTLSWERYPDVRITRSFDELIGMDELDMVVVNTPDVTHYDYARRALEAGKHVIVEKPFTMTAAEGDELVSFAAKKGLVLSVYQNRRWDSDF